MNFSDIKNDYTGRKKIESASGSPKRLWRMLNAITGREKADKSTPSLPPFTAKQFLDFLNDKIAKIRSTTAGSPLPTYSVTSCSIAEFTPITPENLRSLILSSSVATCDLDPIPTFVLRAYIDQLLPFLTVLCNRSLFEGLLPISQKTSRVRP